MGYQAPKIPQSRERLHRFVLFRVQIEERQQVAHLQSLQVGLGRIDELEQASSVFLPKSTISQVLRRRWSPVLHRGQAEAIRHEQTWQPLSALHADPRCSCGEVSRQVRHRRVRAVGAPACSACPAQQSDCRDRQQAGVIAGRAVQLPGLLRCAWKAQPAFHFSTATTTAKTARKSNPVTPET